MKQHYEKVKHMSAELQQKEDARSGLLQQMQEMETSNAEPKSKLDRAIASKSLTAIPIVYVSAAVYCSVLFCIVSIICKIY